MKQQEFQIGFPARTPKYNSIKENGAIKMFLNQYFSRTRVFPKIREADLASKMSCLIFLKALILWEWNQLVVVKFSINDDFQWLNDIMTNI